MKSEVNINHIVRGLSLTCKIYVKVPWKIKGGPTKPVSGILVAKKGKMRGRGSRKIR